MEEHCWHFKSWSRSPIQVWSIKDQEGSHPPRRRVFRYTVYSSALPIAPRDDRLKQIFLRPSIDTDVIRERHAFISVYLRPDNNDPLSKLTRSLKHIKNLRPVMINLRKGISTGSGKITGFKTTVWATLLAVCQAG